MSQEFSEKPSEIIPPASPPKVGAREELALKPGPTESSEEETEELISEGEPRSGSNFMLLGFGFVAILILAVVAMLVITSGDVAETPAPASLSQTAAEGKTLFINSNCNSCHPAEGRAGGTGPRLSTTGLGDANITSTIKRGKGAMPAYSRLSDDQIGKIITYIRAINPNNPKTS